MSWMLVITSFPWKK